jgi:hypothetical protein
MTLAQDPTLKDPDEGAWSVAKLWVGVDIGKAHHHVAAVDGEGRLVFSRKVDNDERDILAVIAEVGAVGRPVCWAVDVTTGLAALLLTLLWRRQTEVRYVSGTVAFHMAAAFAGEKTPGTPSSSRTRCACARTSPSCNPPTGSSPN